MLRLAFVLGLSVSLMAQTPVSPTDTPILTDLQRLQVQNALLRVQLAASELERTREAANALIHSLQRDGFDLNLEQLAYVPKAKPVK